MTVPTSKEQRKEARKRLKSIKKTVKRIDSFDAKLAIVKRGMAKFAEEYLDENLHRCEYCNVQIDEEQYILNGLCDGCAIELE